MDSIVVPPRFNGPTDSGNGGYTAGLLAAALGAGGLLLAYALDLPPGPAIAVLGGAAFAAASAATATTTGRRTSA